MRRDSLYPNMITKFDENAFWSQVDTQSNNCWLWTGTLDGDGYGKVTGYDRSYRASRVSYWLCNGIIPRGLFVCHTCDVPACVRPDHLFLGTYEDNMEDMARKGRVTGRPRRVFDIEAARQLQADGLSLRKIAALMNVPRATLGRGLNASK